ncbi:hypothetical protein [Pseudomonas massiliensis]|uniref:hypothetical protein n=1 Tax=Pseudomonas massiliensis TaxID=522492 RepID=UPI00058E4D07|nr:hypothetical protein [Pseudomonas massiliensis]
MSEMHEQALNSIYRQVLQRLLSLHTHAERHALMNLAERLGRQHQASSQWRPVLVCGADRDSLLAMALLRASQLLVAGSLGETFSLRVIIPGASGIAQADHENVRRALGALFMTEDPRVELLLGTPAELQPYDTIRPAPATTPDTTEGLLAGLWEARAEHGKGLAPGCLRALAQLALRALERPGHDQLVGALAPPLAWRALARARRQLRAGRGRAAVAAPPGLGWLPYLAGNGEVPSVARVQPLLPFMDLHPILPTSTKRRWQLAMQGLGMHVDPLGAAAGLPGCADPLLEAHLAGLAAHHRGQDYQSGLAAHLRPRLERLRQEGVPVRTLGFLRAHYLGEAGRTLQAQRLSQHAVERLGLTETQLSCLLHDPFRDRGARLQSFLAHCHPTEMHRAPQLRRALEGQPGNVEQIHWLQQVSGLPIPLLRQLYVRRSAGQPSMLPRLPCLCQGRRATAPAAIILGQARPSQPYRSSERAGQR